MLDSECAWRHAWNAIADYCLLIPNDDKNLFIDNLAKDLNVIIPNKAPEEYESVTWEQLREMGNYGIQVGGHTRTHPKLTQLEEGALHDEIIDSRYILQNILQQEIHSFAYPNGTRRDFNGKIKSIVKKAGYTNATVGYYDGDLIGDIYELGRYSVGNDMYQFNKAVNGILYISSYIRRYIN